MIIHAAPDYQIYFGNAKDAMYPHQYKNWADFSLFSRDPIRPIADRLRLKGLFFLRQTHSITGYAVSSSFLQSVPPFLKEGDFLITNESHLGIGVLTADCVPLVLYDKKKHVAAIAHAGWRGAVAGIIPAVLAALKETYGSSPHDLSAFIGPSAKRCCYKVGPDFPEQLEAYSYADQLFHKQGSSLFFDLPYFVELQLMHGGVISLCKEYAICTICNKGFHSYRRGVASGLSESVGRQMTIIALK